LTDAPTRSRPPSDASVVVVGVGALGCAAADALARAGVGTLALVDPDVVERSNLHRQLLHRTADLGRPKVESAAEKLRRKHPATRVVAELAKVGVGNAARLFAGVDCVVDATDGIETKFVLNDLAVRLGVPLVHGGVIRFQGQLMTIVPRESACYRCLFSAPPEASDVPSCQEAGVLGAVAGTVGALQAAEALRIALGDVPALRDRLATYDALTSCWRVVRLRRNHACGACGTSEPRAAGGFRLA
jgi:molybdopterin-synthase adenylyltransferase